MQTEVWRVRQDFRNGLYDALRNEPAIEMVTFTVSPDRYPHGLSERAIADMAGRLADHEGSRAVVVAETSKGGTVHLHGLVPVADDRDRIANKRYVETWRRTVGHVHVAPVTDLMGAVTYVTKTFGPNSEYQWRYSDAIPTIQAGLLRGT